MSNNRTKLYEDMDMGRGDCKVSMLLNWNTINTCFLSSAFHVHSSAGFATVCICSFLLVIFLEFLRRLQRKLDNYFRRKHRQQSNDFDVKELQSLNNSQSLVERVAIRDRLGRASARKGQVALEQMVRGVVHMLQFGISYVVMLLVMYSNGYVILSILLGASVGFTMFTRDMIER